MNEFFIKSYIIILILGFFLLLAHSRDKSTFDLDVLDTKKNKHLPISVRIYAWVMIVWIATVSIYIFGTLIG